MFNIIFTPPQRSWMHRIRLFGVFFYISNVRLRKRQLRDLRFTGYRENNYVTNKQKVYERQQHRCPHCGQQYPLDQMEAHHYLPVARYPEYQWSIRNIILLCNRCHREVHCNPFLNIRLMQQKADELGIDLQDRYAI